PHRRGRPDQDMRATRSVRDEFGTLEITNGFQTDLGKVGDEAVRAHFQDGVHDRTVVDGVRSDLQSGLVHGLDVVGVDLCAAVVDPVRPVVVGDLLLRDQAEQGVRYRWQQGLGVLHRLPVEALHDEATRFPGRVVFEPGAACGDFLGDQVLDARRQVRVLYLEEEVEVERFEQIQGDVQGGDGFSLEDGVEPAAGFELFDLFQGEVPDLVGVAVGEHLCCVGGAFQGRVVHEDDFVVRGELDVDLDGPGSQPLCGVEGGQGVLRGVSG